MSSKKIISSVLLIITLLSMNFSSFAAVQVRAADTSQIEVSKEISVFRVYYESPEQIQQLMTFDLFEFNNLEEKYVLVALTADEVIKVEEMGFVTALDKEETANFELLSTISQNQLNTIPGYSCYRTVEETYATAVNIASMHPNLAEWIDIGDSWEKTVGQSDGFDLFVLKLTNKSITGEKPKLFITGSIHAREYTTAEMATRYAEYLVSNYNVDADVTWLLDYHEIHLLLQMNPDGRKEAESGRSWRKNTNENYCGITSTNRGADLNRNYAFYWNYCSGCSSGSPCDATYRGPSAASEPEVSAVQAYMRSIFPDQREAALSAPAPTNATGIFIDLHSYGQLVLWPWGMTTATAPNHIALQTLGRKYAYFNNYTPQKSSQLYTTDGDSTGFAYGDLGVAAYTFEMGTAFFQSCSTFENTIAPTNLQALLYAAKVVRTPYITPAGPDTISLAVSSSTVPAGTAVTLTGVANDTRYKSGSGEATQAIAQAEYYIDTPPWVEGAAAIPMSASDGNFNSTSENLTSIVNTTGWSNGRHILYLRSKDASGNWGAISAIFLTVEGQANQAPIISQGDSIPVIMSEDGNPTPFAVSIDAVDPEGATMTWSLSGSPAHGNASVSGTGAYPTVNFTPSVNFNGADSFVVQVSDGSLTDTITVNLTIQPVNDTPVANGQSVSTAENTAKAITLSGSDIDGDTLTYSVVSQPAHGTLSGTAPSLTYTPADNYHGSDSFTFKVNDGSVDSNIATVAITATVVNDPPVANGQSVSTAEDTAKLITLSGSDTDGDPLSYAVVIQPAHGSLTGTAPNLTYTPSADYHGADSFTFKVNDGSVDSNIATVSITVTPVNDAPVANEQSVSTAEDAAKAITLTGTDIDGNNLTYIIVSQPAHGILSGSAPNVTYTPAANYNGSDSFTFKANDGSVDSNVATVSITITPVNDAPVANGQSVSTAEDTAKAITLLGTDADGNNLTYSVASQPAHGTLSGSAPNVTYTPATNYNGTDSFTFKVNDGTVDSAPATVTIDVTPVNDAPVAIPQELVTTENTALSVTLTGSDIEGTSLIFSVTSGPSNGMLTGSGATLLYTPNANFEGADPFTFTANDGDLTSAPATVSITVTRTNDAPDAIGQNVSTNEDIPVGITLTGTDADNDPLTFEVTVEPLHGALTGTAPNLTYTPASNYHGIDNFSFVVNDGLVDSEEAEVNISVASVNDVPIALPQSKTVVEDTPTEILLTGTDVDENSLDFIIENQPVHGVLSGPTSNLIYTPSLNYNGSDSFTFKAFDGSSYSEAATVSLTVTAVNDAPIADAQSVSLMEDGSVSIVLSGSDIEGNSLNFTIQTQPTHGSLSGTGANRTYTPSANYYGNDSFTFVVNDGETNSAPATVGITVTAVNDAPVALPQTLSVDEDTTLNVTLTGSDVDMDGLAFTVLNNPSSGTLSGTIPDLVYTPAANFNGSDMFTFTVSDGTLISSSATISLTVRPVNDLPMAMGQAVVTDENTPVNITLEAEDIDGDTLTYTIDVGPQHGVLSGSIPNLVYTPDDYYSGIDSFSFYVSDGNAISNSANVSVQILDFNYLPIVFNQTLSTNENTPLSITLTGMDPDGDMLDFFIISPPENGNLSGTAPDLVYTPNSGYTGSDSFTFAATDNQGESNVGVISIQVNAAGPATVFFDDFETSLGWVRNPFGTDTATLGYFERANPDSVAYYGDKQLGTTVSGSYDLVTGPLAGSSAGAYDLDGGKTSVLSPTIDLPVGRELTLSFSYYVSHYTNSSNADYLRVFIIGDSTVKVFEELGANNDDDAVWDAFSADISSFAGQSIQILIEAADASTASYFEAAVDDVGIIASTPNNPPIAVGGSNELLEDGSVPLSLSGSDPEGNAITFQVTTLPSHGTLIGIAPNLTYIPAANYSGSDSFVFVTNDGKLNSEPAIITLDITAVNDAPLAVAMNLSTTVDVPFSFSLSGTDVEGDVLSYTVSLNPSQGVLSGTAPNLIYTPTLGYIGPDSFQFTVNDGSENSLPATVSITVNPAGPTTIFWDDFETDQGWVRNPFGTDTARLGYWERANPDTVSYSGYKQLGTTVSGSYDLVTGPSAGSSAGSYDLDGGITSIQSPYFTLPTGRNLVLSLKYYMAHASNSSSADYLRVKIVGTSTQTILQELGARNDDDAAWATLSISLNTFAGQTVYLLIEASDSPSESLVEAAIDDILIIAE